jgi:hypothetical protein
MQAFGGNRAEGDNNAILLTCNELKDNDVICYNGNEY